MKEYELTEADCALCGRNDAKLMFVGKDKLHKKNGCFSVVRCNQCGLVYTNPRPTEETIQHFYPSDYVPYQEENLVWRYLEVFSKKNKLSDKVKNDAKSVILKHRYAYPLDFSLLYPNMMWFYLIINKMFLSYFKKVYYRIPRWVHGGRALDFGCGAGAYLLMLQKLGWDVVGFDIAKIQSKYLGVHDVPVLSGSLDIADLKDNSFDLVTLWHSLEHTHQPLSVLKKMHNLLKRGGLICVEVPNNESCSRYLFGENWFPWELPRHLYHFSPRTLKEMLSKAGFKDITIHHLRKKTILKSFRYWFEDRNISFDLEHSRIANCLITFIAGLFSLLRRSEIVFASARKAGYESRRK